MTWWGEAFGKDTRDPTRKYRFLLKMGVAGADQIVKSAKSVSKPKATNESKEYKMINHYYNYPGLVRWEPIVITLVDIGNFAQTFIDDKKDTTGTSVGLKTSMPSTANALWEMLLASGYSTPNGESGISQRAKSISSPEKASTIDNSFGKILEIHQLDSNGKVIEYWKLYNPIITKISWGDLDYADDGLVEYSIDVKYDWAILKNSKGDNETSATVKSDGDNG